MSEHVTRTWIQQVRNELGFVSTHGDKPVTARWEGITGQFHVHIGSFRGRPQITLIMAGKPYTFEDNEDILGTCAATGSLSEMEQVFETYARML